MRPLEIGLVFETFETYSRRPGDPVDAHVEFEPESTIEALESAIRSLGHRPRRLGSPQDLLMSIAAGNVGEIDVAFNLAEGMGGRNREAWAPVLLEMAGIPTLGSDALSLSLSLDKAWANAAVAAAGDGDALDDLDDFLLADDQACWELLANTALLPPPTPTFSMLRRLRLRIPLFLVE